MLKVNKRSLIGLSMVIVIVMAMLLLSSCALPGPQGERGETGADGLTPFIGENGNWWIGGVDTGVAAAGLNGKDGVDGMDGADGSNGADGKDGADGQVGPQGEQGMQGDKGDQGDPGITPVFSFNKEKGYLYVSYDNELTWSTLLNIYDVIEDGKDGVSISSCDLNDAGELIITYSTGDSQNLGVITGAAGADGKDGIDGKDGANGQDGVGISNVEISSGGELIITLTDDTVINLGNIKGKDGKDGSDGINGENGKDGKNGEEGITPRLRINAENEMWQVSYDNGKTWEDLGVVARGEDGRMPRVRINTATKEWEVSYDNGSSWQGLGVSASGAEGEDGVGISDMLIDDEGCLTVILTDGTEFNLGSLRGEDGDDGTGIINAEINESGNLIITLTDGSALDLGLVKGEDGQKGDDGERGVTPQIRINPTDMMWEVSYNNGASWESLGFKATAGDSDSGAETHICVIPQLRIDPDTAEWEVSYDEGETWNGLDMVATGEDGQKGDDGKDGTTPRLRINSENIWEVSYDNGVSWESLGVTAVGASGQNGDKGDTGDKGDKGEKGDKGDSGRGIASLEIRDDGFLWVTYTDSAEAVCVGRVTSDTTGGETVIPESYTDGLAFYPIENGQEYGVAIGNAMYMETIVIPATYNGKPVTRILTNAFTVDMGDAGRINTILKEITIPSSVKEICAGAFSNCTALETVIIPEGVEIIGDYAFGECINLTVTVPATVTSIGTGAFEGVKSVTYEE